MSRTTASKSILRGLSLLLLLGGAVSIIYWIAGTSLSESFQRGFSYTGLVLIAYLSWFLSWWAFKSHPFLFWGLVGAGLFSAMTVTELWIKRPEYYSPFQGPLVLPIALFNLCLAILILLACAYKSKHPKQPFGIYSKWLFFVLLNGFFINMLVIPTGLEAWRDFFPFILLLGLLNLLALGAWLEQIRRK